MKKATVILCTIAMVLCVAGAAGAVPVTFNYTADNVTLVFATQELPGDYNPTTWDTQSLGVNNSNWRISDSSTIDVNANTLLQVLFIAMNDTSEMPAGSGNPGGFLADIIVGDTTYSTSPLTWFAGVMEEDPATPLSYSFLNPMAIPMATSYGTNGVSDPNIWAYVPGISESAEWIWAADNYGASPDIVGLGTYVPVASAPVPEPATLLLLGTGLLGIVAVGRKRFQK